MRKLVVLGLCTLMVSGCTLETVEPEPVKEPEPKVIEKVIEFEPRNVEAEYIIIDSESLNVREDADVDSKRLGQVSENQTYQVLEEKDDSQKRVWYKITTKEGVTGYVAGWYCAKTKIVIHVEADEATILEVETLPKPRYVNNPFQTKSARIGDQIVGFVIKEISQVGEMNRILFEGEVELTGSFYHENSDLSFGRVVRFVPDEASSVLLPRIKQEVSSVAFILDDYDKVADQFGQVGTTGTATITVKNYSIGYGGAKNYNQGVMVKVDTE